MNIATNLTEIQGQIRRFEGKYHRPNGSVELLAVSKTRNVGEIGIAIAQGQRHFGENYCQEAIEKIETINNHNLVWHFIGPVQSNKTSQIAHYFDWVHTVDRIKIARRLNEQRPTDKPPVNVCVQVNISGEESKSGISICELKDFIEELKTFERIKIRGLMTLPAPSADIKEQRIPFAKLREHMIQLKDNYPELETLSMGTTGDMEAAIAEGATIVRIGTAIFGSRNASN